MAHRFLLLGLVMLFCIAQVSGQGNIDPQEKKVAVDCGGLCRQRCLLHSRPNVCNRACGTCCMRCQCVPPGPYGNRELCGSCYTDMKTHDNRPKCP